MDLGLWFFFIRGRHNSEGRNHLVDLIKHLYMFLWYGVKIPSDSSLTLKCSKNAEFYHNNSLSASISLLPTHLPGILIFRSVYTVSSRQMAEAKGAKVSSVVS